MFAAVSENGMSMIKLLAGKGMRFELKSSLLDGGGHLGADMYKSAPYSV